MGTTNKNLELPAYNSTTWNTPLNSNFQIIDNTFGNSTTVNVGSADQVLTYSSLQAMRLLVTGNIGSSNRIITIPAGVGGYWIVTNATTYTTGSVTLKSAAGGSGLVLTPGGSAIAYSNGSDIYSATSGATGSYLPLTGGTLSGPLSVQSTLSVSGQSAFSSNAIFGGGMTLPVGQTFNVYGNLALGASNLAANSIALGSGAIIGTNALAVVGTSTMNGNLTLPGGNISIATGSLTVTSGSASNTLNGTTTVQNLTVTGTLSASSYTPTSLTLSGQLVVNGAGANTLTGTTTVPSGSKIVIASGATLDASQGILLTSAISPASINTPGNITGGNLISSGYLTVNGTYGISATGVIAGTALTTPNGGISSSGAITGASIVLSGTYGISATGALVVSSATFGSSISTQGLDAGSGAITTTGNITGTNVTANGALTGSSLVLGGGNGITSLGAITGTSLALGTGTITSGAITSGAVTSSGRVTCTSVVAGTGNISCGSLTSTGAISGTSLGLGTGAITCGSITGSSGGISSAGIVTGTSLNIGTGAITAGSITLGSTGSITSAGAITGTSLALGTGSATVGGVTINAATPNISWNVSGTNRFGTYVSGGTTFTIANNGATNYLTLTTTAASGISVTGAYNNVSDASMKENVIEIMDALDIVKGLRGVYFDWVGVQKDKKNVGFIAQEVEPILPEVVSSADDGKLGVSYSSIVAVLVNAVKELEARVAELEK